MAHKRSNIFEGRWGVVSSEYYNHDSGKWELYNQFEEGEYWMTFSTDKIVDMPNQLSYEGRVTEYCQSFKTTDSLYIYEVDDMGQRLIIDRSDYHEDGFLDVCVEDIFTIQELLNSDNNIQSLYLNLSDGVDFTHPSFRFKLIILMG